jgi:hypothetical protein
VPEKALSRCTACDRWIEYGKPTMQEVVALELGEGDWSWPIEVVCPTCGRRWDETHGVRVSMIENRPHSA